MKTFTLRLTETELEQLKCLARTTHRSMQKQIAYWIERDFIVFTQQEARKQQQGREVEARRA